MIEVIVRNYLAEHLDVEVYMERPVDVPESYVILEKTSGGIRNYINEAAFAIQSYAASLYEAAALNEQVKEAMNGLILLNEVARSKLNSDYNYTDPTTKEYRYQCVYDVTYY